MDVLCCCKPENKIGELPEGSPLPIWDTIDEHGNIGKAYSSDNLNLDSIRAMDGFQMGKRKGGKKTWKK